MNTETTAMTAQEVFTKVATHLIAQGKPAFDAVGQCAYRGEEGSMCAVGCLIEDHEYVPAMEGESVETLAANGLLPDRLCGHEVMLNDLQHLHDNEGPGSWPRRLAHIAEDYGLTMTAQEVAA